MNIGDCYYVKFSMCRHIRVVKIKNIEIAKPIKYRRKPKDPDLLALETLEPTTFVRVRFLDQIYSIYCECHFCKPQYIKNGSITLEYNHLADSIVSQAYGYI